VKNDGQVRQKLKQVLFRHRKEFVRLNLSRRPENCEHNATVRLPLHVSSRAGVRVCGFVDPDGDWNDRVCDSALGGDRQAGRCPHYSCRNTAELLKADFNERVGLGEASVEIGQLASEYPDVAALMWVLGPSDGDPSPTVLDFFGEEGGDDCDE
jgi:hypothetical protein